MVTHKFLESDEQIREVTISHLLRYFSKFWSLVSALGGKGKIQEKNENKRWERTKKRVEKMVVI